MNQAAPRNLKLAIPLAIIAALAISASLIPVKFLAGFPTTGVVLFVRYFIILLIVFPFIYVHRGEQSVGQFLKTKRPVLHIVRGVCGTLSVFCYFYASTTLPLADITVLFSTAPLFIPLIARVWGGIKIIHQLWWGICIGFIGVICILHPGKELFHLDALFGLLSGFLAGVTYVANRYLTYTEPPLRNLFYYFVLGTVCALLVALSHIHQLAQLNLKAWLLLIAIGILGYIYQYSFTVATRNAPVRLITTFLNCAVIFSLLFDFFIWHIIPSWLSVAGIILTIVGSVLLVVLYPKES